MIKTTAQREEDKPYKKERKKKQNQPAKKLMYWAG